MKKLSYISRNTFSRLSLNKRSFLLTVLWLLATGNIISQDLLILKNGLEVKARILEISDYYIDYQKYDDPAKSTVTIPKSNVFMIKYENGTKEVFEHKPTDSHVAAPVKPAAPVESKFDPDTSDFAKIRKKNFSGPRVGVTYVTPGTAADYLASNGKRPLVTQFGWQFEGRLFTVEETSGIVEFVPMIGGLEQGMFIPSANLLIGVRSGKRIPIEFALGPNFSVGADHNGNKQGFAGLVIALGTSLRKGNINFPITLAFVPSVGNVAEIKDEETQTTEKITYRTGSRISLIVGFNTRRK